MRISYEPLRVLLVRKRMRLTDLQRMTGIAGATLSRIGRDESMNLLTLLAIAEVLRCPVQDIVAFEEENDD